MSAPTARATDPLHAFVASTRRLMELLDQFDPAEFEPGVQHQLDSFDALKSAISTGAVPQSPGLAAAIDEGQRTLSAVSGRMHALRDEIDGLRTARARASRRPGTEVTAQFVSRRV